MQEDLQQDMGGEEGDDAEESKEESQKEDDQTQDKGVAIEIELPKVDTSIGDDVYFVKLPNFLSIETKPFDSAFYEDEIDEDDVLDDEGRARLKLKVILCVQLYPVTFCFSFFFFSFWLHLHCGGYQRGPAPSLSYVSSLAPTTPMSSSLMKSLHLLLDLTLFLWVTPILLHFHPT